MAKGDLTKEQVQNALPAKLKSSATQSLTDKINNSVNDPIIAEQIRDNFITYTTVLKDGKYKTEDYLNAVTYVSFKLMGLTNLECYQHTFPKRYEDLIKRGSSSSQIASYVSAYHKGKLVNSILEQSLIPTWILNQDIYQKAINTQASLMINANSEKVQCDAANSLLTHLKRPEVKDININLGAVENNGMRELTDTLRELAKAQQETISAGASTREVAAEPLVRRLPAPIDGEFEEID